MNGEPSPPPSVRPSSGAPSKSTTARSARRNVDLLIPSDLDDDASFSLAPGIEVTAQSARDWVSGVGFLPSAGPADMARALQEMPKSRQSLMATRWLQRTSAAPTGRPAGCCGSTTLGETDLDAIAHELNHRPHKTHRYRPVAEAYSDILSSSDALTV